MLRRTSSKIMEGLTTVKSAARIFPHFDSSQSHTHENTYRRKPPTAHHHPSAHQSALQATYQGHHAQHNAQHHQPHPVQHPNSHKNSHINSSSSQGLTLRVSSHSHSASHNSQGSSGSSSSSKSAHSPSSSHQHIDDDLFVPSSQEFDFDRLDGAERVTKRSDLWKYRVAKQRRNLPEGFELKTWRKPEEVEKESLGLVNELKSKANQ